MNDTEGRIEDLKGRISRAEQEVIFIQKCLLADKKWLAELKVTLEKESEVVSMGLDIGIGDDPFNISILRRVEGESFLEQLKNYEPPKEELKVGDYVTITHWDAKRPTAIIEGFNEERTWAHVKTSDGKIHTCGIKHELKKISKEEWEQGLYGCYCCAHFVYPDQYLKVDGKVYIKDHYHHRELEKGDHVYDSYREECGIIEWIGKQNNNVDVQDVHGVIYPATKDNLSEIKEEEYLEAWRKQLKEGDIVKCRGKLFEYLYPHSISPDQYWIRAHNEHLNLEWSKNMLQPTPDEIEGYNKKDMCAGVACTKPCVWDKDWDPVDCPKEKEAEKETHIVPIRKRTIEERMDYLTNEYAIIKTLLMKHLKDSEDTKPPKKECESIIRCDRKICLMMSEDTPDTIIVAYCDELKEDGECPIDPKEEEKEVQFVVGVHEYPPGTIQEEAYKDHLANEKKKE